MLYCAHFAVVERHQSVATETVPPARLITDTDTADGTTATAITTAVNAAETRAAEDWIKMRTSKVTVLPYDAAWADDFEKIKCEIVGALGDLAEGVEHVGSTAVFGLSAKPCIDIDVVIADYSTFDAVMAALSDLGYFHEGDLGIAGREAFGYTDKPHLKKHHLYVCPRDSEELHRHITFRDFLRVNPDVAEEYGRVKTEAARLYPDDIDGYIAHKSPIIEKIYRRCGLK